ncbi:hypothetical protein V8B97DRAFT_48939 [Scleroderma yunnanense]
MPMIEPLAAAIANRVLPRNPAPRTSTLKSAIAAMGKPVRHVFPGDFFTPYPRLWKGKARAQDPVTFECTECIDHPTGPITAHCCAARHSLWCPKRNRLFMMSEIIPRRLRTAQSGGSPRNTRRHASSSAPRLFPLSAHEFEATSQAHQGFILQTLPSTIDIRSLLDPSVPFDPNEAWALYSHLIKTSSQDPFTPDEHLLFMEKMMDAVEPTPSERASMVVLHKWGLRLCSIMQRMEVDPSGLAFEDFRWLCLSARIAALQGDFPRAVRLMKKTQTRHLMEAEQRILIGAYRSLLVFAHLSEGSTAVLGLVLEEWNFFGPYLGRYRNPFTDTPFQTQSEALRGTALKVIAGIPNGVSLLSSWRNNEEVIRTAELLLLSYLSEGLLEDAYAVMVAAHSQQLLLSVHHQLALVRALTKTNLFALGNETFSFIRPSSYKPYLSLGLYLHARQGNVTRAEEFFHSLRRRNGLTPIDRAMLMHAYAVSGRVETVIELFHEFFPEKERRDEPMIFHYTAVIFAYAQRKDFDGLNHWLKTMIQAGHTPDAHVYSIILESFASQGEVDTVAAILDQMRAAGIQPTRVHYTTVIKFLALRRDPASAEAIYKRALREGITPDHIMITALMNAHVEAGSWAGVIRIFDYFKASRYRNLSLTIQVYNTLLKAYVLIGTPFHTVLALFRKLRHTGACPDAYTYALVIQSACDTGLMNIASDLFAEMQDRVIQWQPHRGIEIYVLTIIMAGHLRLGHKLQAKDVYEDMISRGIQPTSITFSQILHAYGNQGTKESLQIAESFLQNIVNADPERRTWATPGSLQAALETLHSPLMSIYSKQRDKESVERLFEAMLDAGGEPSFVSLTILLDVYRRSGNIDAVHEVWEQVWELALRRSRVDELFKDEDLAPMSPLSRQSNLLCLPLSIYIDALSAAGQHSAVPDIWLKARSHGFSFDSHNWNHLAVTLVRAAELDRAFAVVERVILPYQHQSLVMASTRDLSPNSPLTFDTAPPNVDNPASESPMHNKKRRAAAVILATKKFRHHVDMDGDPNDFAHPLHILHQVLPSWNVWRPHHVILELLGSVLRHLQGGRIVEPVGASSHTPLESGSLASRARTASDTLLRIYNEYPSTVRAVLLHDRAISRQNALKKLDRWR